eukprot:GCRY01001296.1.p1 GENE.GCRY01001296.1~~GCRY01001296.1.p1  ORF type:complete len:334 (+),score=24.02 GCRY01001296.1:157-1158(+)
MFFEEYRNVPIPSLKFEECFHIVPMLDKPTAENGGKILLPPSALERLSRMNVSYPMLFRLTNFELGRSMHCGVLEFTANEGEVGLPFWMIENLFSDIGHIIQITNVSLPKGTFVKLQPHTSDFLDITNPKAVLEKTFRDYSCLTKDDVIKIEYNSKVYTLNILAVKPGDAVSIFETNLEVDFAPPLDYKEKPKLQPTSQFNFNPEKQQPLFTSNGLSPSISRSSAATSSSEPILDEEDDEPTFVPFSGSGQRLDGKSLSSRQRRHLVPSASPRTQTQPKSQTPIPLASTPQAEDNSDSLSDSDDDDCCRRTTTPSTAPRRSEHVWGQGYSLRG